MPGHEPPQFLDVGKLKNQYLDYWMTKVDEIDEQKTSRYYYHGAQITPAQMRILKARHQPPMVWNRTNRKINAIVGLAERQRSDPKALPRHVSSEQGANIATQCIRYVLDANDFDTWWPGWGGGKGESIEIRDMFVKKPSWIVGRIATRVAHHRERRLYDRK